MRYLLALVWPGAAPKGNTAIWGHWGAALHWLFGVGAWAIASVAVFRIVHHESWLYVSIAILAALVSAVCGVVFRGLMTIE